MLRNTKMYSNTQQISVCVCYEKNRGGETIATQNLLIELNKINNLKLFPDAYESLTSTDSFNFISWNISSLLFWSKHILKNANLKWVYTTTYTAGTAAVLLKPFFKYKVCFHYHGSRIPEKPSKIWVFQKISQYSKRISVLYLHKYFLRFTDLIIVPSKYTLRILKKNLPDLKNKNCVIIPNGINEKFFQKIKSSNLSVIKNKLNLQNNVIVILYVGRIHPKKKLRLLLLIFSKLITKIQNLKLLIVYPHISLNEERIYYDKLARIVKINRLEKNIHFIDSPKNIHKLYSVADIVISLSKIENSPLVLLESLASKKLFIASDHPAFSEILNKIDKRLILQQGTAQNISKQIYNIIFLDNNIKRLIINRGYSLVQNFTWRCSSELLYSCFLKY